MDGAVVIDLSNDEEGADDGGNATHCPVCMESMVGVQVAQHSQCRKMICMDCFTKINTAEPEESQLDEALIPSGSCPICRTHLQWIDPNTQREIHQIYGFWRSIHERETLVIPIETVNEWNSICDSFGRPNLKVHYGAAVIDLTSSN
jgi:hypothetical protein